MNCRECPSASCLKDPSKIGGSAAAPPPAQAQPPNGGAIAGAVIGGLAVIAVATYLVWRFCIKNRRGEYEEQWYDEAQSKEGGMGGDAATMRSKRNSAHTVHSIASTVLTRASNIIQIAYIPGVTNRAQANDPNVLVPPVPPIPLAHSEHANKRPEGDEQHFFVPGNLRDSTYSGISTNTDRTSYAARSYAPRSSVASTIYGKNAVVSSTPAQRGNFLKPSLVSVKSRTGSEKSGDAPPVPEVNYEKYDKPPPSPAFSIGATFFKNASASTAQTARPQMVRVGSNGPKEVEVKPKSSQASPAPSDTNSEKTTPPQGDDKTGSEAATTAHGAPATASQSPFVDPPSTPSSSTSTRENNHVRHISTGDLGRPKPEPVRDASPFGDQHAVKDN